ncbi:hypothetical protein D9Q98_004699 [Chlorella vulgaris]|uniref:Ion transport domain-containing protein n=1 Tax=Chlorella vulgaris TaxID=3077 RepID=A0A9D4TQ48_CHLVU|nr:hypothetical protein D9Q98_004699 [Chlorella vulgaris]
MSDRQPLLGYPDEDRVWDRVESGPADLEHTIGVEEVFDQHPSDVLRLLQSHGVRKVAEFSVQDKLILGKIGDDSIVTMGADRPDIDYEAAWRRELGEPSTKPAGWTASIPVCAYVVTVRDAVAADKKGLLQPLLKRWQAGGMSFAAFALPPVQAVIDWKWSRFCRHLLLWELGFFMLWLASFFCFTIFFQDEDTHLSLRELLATSRGRITVACDAVALLAMTPFVIIEVSTMVAYGLLGWATVWNVLDACTYIVQIAVVMMHVGRLNINSDWLSILAATQCVLLLFRLQYFSRVFPATRFSFLDSLKEVLHDVKMYLLFLVLVMLGFATSFHVLYRRDQEKHDEFSNMGKSFVTMVTWVAGNAELTPLYKDAHNPMAASILGILYVFILATVLTNLLISIMTTSLEKVTKDEGLRMLLSKAQAIDELEATIPPFVERFFPNLYPPFLHVLRTDPDKLDSVKLDKLWANSGEDESEELLEGGKTPQTSSGQQQADVSGLAAKVDALSADVAEIKALLQRLAAQGPEISVAEQ